MQRNIYKPEFFIELKTITLKKPLGGGSFGDVYEASYQQQTIACKFIKQASTEDSPEKAKNIHEKITREMFFLNRLQEKNVPSIVKFIGWSEGTMENQPYAVILMEYANLGSLYNVIKNDKAQLADPCLKQSLIEQIATGIEGMHQMSVVHNDFKSPNILLHRDLMGNIHAKIADFGSTHFEDQEYCLSTSLWLAPEKGLCLCPTDMYSLGTVMWEIIEPVGIMKAYMRIFKNKSNNFSKLHDFASDHIQRGLRLYITPEQGSFNKLKLEMLIHSCWSQDPSKRMTAEELMHAYSMPVERIFVEFGHKIPFLFTLLCKYGQVDLIKQMLASPVDLNEIAYDGSTPLITACQHKQFKTVQLLLEYGMRPDETNTRVDIHKRSYYNENAFFSALAHDNPDLTIYLIKFCPPLLTKRSQTETPLDCALRLGLDNNIKVLLQSCLEQGIHSTALSYKNISSLGTWLNQNLFNEQYLQLFLNIIETRCLAPIEESIQPASALLNGLFTHPIARQESIYYARRFNDAPSICDKLRIILDIQNHASSRLAHQVAGCLRFVDTQSTTQFIQSILDFIDHYGNKSRLQNRR